MSCFYMGKVSNDGRICRLYHQPTAKNTINVFQKDERL
jgi:hypothetical protein